MKTKIEVKNMKKGDRTVDDINWNYIVLNDSVLVDDLNKEVDKSIEIATKKSFTKMRGKYKEWDFDYYFPCWFCVLQRIKKDGTLDPVLFTAYQRLNGEDNPEYYMLSSD